MRQIARPASLVALTATLGAAVHPAFLLGTVILIADCRARQADYERYLPYPFNPQLATSLGRSWCGRGVAQTIWYYQARDHYREKGYRWYHILPDGFPCCFFQVGFWRSVLGIRT